MNDNHIKRKEWIKTAAIVFLTIMLILTFFSNTIMNHSLPEVATKTVQSGTITTKIRGSGNVESGDPYTVEIESAYIGRKVASIPVKVGDKVQKGDILFYLKEGDSTELEAAKEALEAAKDALKSAQDAYDMEILKAGITNSDINSAKSNVSTATYRKMITELQAAIKAAEDKVPPLQKDVDQLDQAIADCEKQISYEGEQKELAGSKLSTAKTAAEQADAAQKQAQAVYDAAKSAVETIQKEIADLEAQASSAPAANEEEADGEENAEGAAADAGQAAGADQNARIQAQKDELEKKLESAKKTLEEAQKALDSSNKKLQDANSDYASAAKNKDEKDSSQVANNVGNQKSEYEIKKYNCEKELKAPEAEVEKLKKQLEELIGKIGDVTKLEGLQDEIAKAQKVVADKQKKVTELTGESSGMEILADAPGTITAINVSSGKKIETKDVVTLQAADAGYFMSFSVTNEQARTVSVGDKASLVNAWYFNDLDITLKSIKPDKAEPGKKKMLTFEITGDATVGQNISVSVGQKSQSYDCIVPNSALHHDLDGDFVLTVESKSTPLGNRYIATRVDV